LKYLHSSFKRLGYHIIQCNEARENTMVITKNNLKLEIDNVDDQYLDVLYQLIKKLPIQQKQKTTHKPDFKTFLLNIPKIDELEIKRQRDFPKDVVL
jgi:hypothetical protein